MVLSERDRRVLAEIESDLRNAVGKRRRRQVAWRIALIVVLAAGLGVVIAMSAVAGLPGPVAAGSTGLLGVLIGLLSYSSWRVLRADMPDGVAPG